MKRKRREEEVEGEEKRGGRGQERVLERKREEM